MGPYPVPKKSAQELKDAIFCAVMCVAVSAYQRVLLPNILL